MLKRASGLIAAGFVGAWIALAFHHVPAPAAVSEPARIIQADKVILKGPDGSARMILSGGNEHGAASILFLGPDVKPALSVMLTREGTGAIRLRNGRGGVTIAAETDGQSIIAIEDREGRERIRVRVAPDGKPEVEKIGLGTVPKDDKPSEGGDGRPG